MPSTHGLEPSGVSSAQDGAPEQQPAARYLVLIDAADRGARIGRMFLASLEEVAEFDADAPEVAAMTDGLLPRRGALQRRWDRALGGHSASERAGAEIYTFDV